MIKIVNIIDFHLLLLHVKDFFTYLHSLITTFSTLRSRLLQQKCHHCCWSWSYLS